jgi:hypothetical protein
MSQRERILVWLIILWALFWSVVPLRGCAGAKPEPTTLEPVDT